MCRELFMALSNCRNIPAAATTLFLAASLPLTNQLPGENSKVNNLSNGRKGDQSCWFLNLRSPLAARRSNDTQGLAMLCQVLAYWPLAVANLLQTPWGKAASFPYHVSHKLCFIIPRSWQQMSFRVQPIIETWGAGYPWLNFRAGNILRDIEFSITLKTMCNLRGEVLIQCLAFKMVFGYWLAKDPWTSPAVRSWALPASHFACSAPAVT